MGKSDLAKVDFELRKLFRNYSQLYMIHQWPSEQMRWVELIFALVSRVCDKPEPEIRYVIEELDDLGLLRVEDLSEIPIEKGEADLTHPAAGAIVGYLTECGFTKQMAKNSLLIMKEAAESLKKHHEGKVQK